MKICITITAERGEGGPMEAAIALAKSTSDGDLAKLEALGRCINAAAKVERERRKPEMPPAQNKQPAATRGRVTPTRETL